MSKQKLRDMGKELYIGDVKKPNPLHVCYTLRVNGI